MQDCLRQISRQRPVPTFRCFLRILLDHQPAGKPLERSRERAGTVFLLTGVHSSDLIWVLLIRRSCAVRIRNAKVEFDSIGQTQLEEALVGRTVPTIPQPTWAGLVPVPKLRIFWTRNHKSILLSIVPFFIYILLLPLFKKQKNTVPAACHDVWHHPPGARASELHVLNYGVIVNYGFRHLHHQSSCFWGRLISSLSWLFIIMDLSHQRFPFKEPPRHHLESTLYNQT